LTFIIFSLIFVKKTDVMRKLLLSMLLLFIITIGCKEEDPIPFYEVVPVVEINNAFFDEIYTVTLKNTLSVNGVETTTLWEIPFRGARYGCNLLKWVGEPVEYQAPTILEFTVTVYYDVTGDGGGVLLENFSDGYLPKEATWIRAYFEVRDRNNPSDRYVGIEQYSDPLSGDYQAPTVVWQVTQDLNFVPTAQASPSSNARIADVETVECEDCIWTKIN
jgi:hypothetical protein